MRAVSLTSVLSPDDLAPVDVVNPCSTYPVLLLCEHAGTAIPEALGNLGIDRETLISHRGWDIGAENVARRVADQLGAPLILQRYSRLVIDCNRSPSSVQSIPEYSGGAVIPGNQRLSKVDRQARIEEIFMPLDQEITEQFNHPKLCAISIHSFTPVFDGQDRPWHAGFLNRARPNDCAPLMSSVQLAAPESVLALNQPYQIEDDSDWFIPAHVEKRDIAHSLIEIRNDQIDTDAGAARWAGLLADAILNLMEDQS